MEIRSKMVLNERDGVGAGQPAKPTAYSRVSINLRQANLLAISFGAPLVYFRQRLVSIIKNRLWRQQL